MLKETIKGMTKKLKLLVFLYDFQATIGLRLYGTLEGQMVDKSLLSVTWKFEILVYSIYDLLYY